MIKRFLKQLIIITKYKVINYYISTLFVKPINFYCNSAPMCYQKLKITGKGIVVIKEQCSFGYKLGGRNKYGIIELQARTEGSIIEIGKNVSSNNNLFVCSCNKIIIGDDTLIGEGVTIMDFEAHNTDPITRKECGKIGSVTIGKNVWIGSNVTILKNTFIGDNCIVATGSVVNKQFPSNVVVGGIPARILKTI